jgi:O-antigen/teichoic acid export membrane protein
VFGKELLNLFGDDFVVAYPILVILIVGQLANAMTGPVALLLNMTGHQTDAARILGAGVILNVTLNALLIPAYGPTGAALAGTVTMVLLNTNMAIAVWHRLRIVSVALLAGRKAA